MLVDTYLFTFEYPPTPKILVTVKLIFILSKGKLMKLFLIPALLLLLITVNIFPAQAQSRISLIGGPTASSMNGSYVQSSDGVELGFSAGLLLERQFGDTWALVTGFLWVQKGGKRLALASTGQDTYGFVTQYLQVPILIMPGFAISGGSLYVGPFAGVGISANFGCKTKDGDRFEFEDDCEDNVLSGSAKLLELSVPFGVHVWYAYPGGSRFLLGLQYEFGLTNVFQVASDVGQSAKNNVFRFFFGFSYPLQ